MRKLISKSATDFPAATVVFLIALPLCLGIALGSNAPLFSGIIAGIIGGIVVGIFSGSSLSVSGPAAGLTAVVAMGIGKLPAFEAFLLAVTIAGVFQIIFGFLKAGVIGDYVPNAVIRGMLAAIGIILILKQLPHLVGYDKDFSGDEAFIQIDQRNTFSELIYAINYLSPASFLIGIVSVIILLAWDRPFIKKSSWAKYFPGPLLVVGLGTVINELLVNHGSRFIVEKSHLVNLPVAKSYREFIQFFSHPKWEYISSPQVWITAITIAMVASLETLLGIEAVDKIDPYNRRTPANRELKAQGFGNLISGLLGGLPITSVIVRSAANVEAGAKSKLSTICHGVLLLLSVIFFPELINKVPLSALASILVITGYKLAKPSLFRELHRKGLDQLIPFIATILAILFSDLLTGILIGIGVSLFFLVRSNFKSSVVIVNNDKSWLVRFRKDVSFLNKPIVKDGLDAVPDGSYVLIDLTRADFIDKDIVDVINEFMHRAPLKMIRIDIKKSNYKSAHQHFIKPQPINVIEK
jgi:MFS superfamily sulfate permease-like transporter